MQAPAETATFRMCARFSANTAAGAAVLLDIKLTRGLKPLGIVAPNATKRTALEKDRRSDAAPVIQREFLDIEDNSLHGLYRIFLACHYVILIFLVKLHKIRRPAPNADDELTVKLGVHRAFFRDRPR